MEGTLDYQKVAGSDYNYIVVLAELTPSGGDLSEYDTSTPQRREMTARIILSSEYHAKCKSVKVVRESSFTDNEHQKKWARGTWWKLDVQCD